MPVEKILIHRKGQILSTEKMPCQICKKDTDQDVVYFLLDLSVIYWHGSMKLLTIRLLDMFAMNVNLFQYQ